MTDAACVAFLQWALPRMGLRWAGFRRVRRQVCKRLARRLRGLGLPHLEAYRAWLAEHPDEWAALDDLCRITISRFRRDRAVWEGLAGHVLPSLARAASDRGASTLRAWSAGCASGEEPYTLAILWREALQAAFPDVALHVLATDVDPHLLARARRACYPPGALREVPDDWREAAFVRAGAHLCLREVYRGGVSLVRADLRQGMPRGPFALILCRNLAFTYFDAQTQARTAAALAERLLPGGALVLGTHEALPPGDWGVVPHPGAAHCWVRAEGAAPLDRPAGRP